MRQTMEGLVLAALVANGILAGLSLDKVIVQLPARQRIGVVAYASYARAADLGNGVVLYATVGIAAAILTLAAFGAALADEAPIVVRLLLAVAALLTVGHSAATGRAAPTMFRIGRASETTHTDDTGVTLASLLTRFARLSMARAALQVATFLVVVAAMAVPIVAPGR